MPKQVISSHQPGSASEPSFMVVEVGWAKASIQPGAYVTVAAFDSRTHSPHGRAEDFGFAHVDRTPLSRSDINTLIRALRKARDEAFGADA